MPELDDIVIAFDPGDQEGKGALRVPEGLAHPTRMLVVAALRRATTTAQRSRGPGGSPAFR